MPEIAPLAIQYKMDVFKKARSSGIILDGRHRSVTIAPESGYTGIRYIVTDFHAIFLDSCYVELVCGSRKSKHSFI